MKYRCAYCKQTFGPELGLACPHCGKSMYIPANVRRLSFRERRRAHKRLAREADRERMRTFVSALRPGQRPGGLMVVIAVLLIAGGALLGKVRRLPPSRPPPKPTSTAVAREELRILKTALDDFKRDCGRYPATEEGMESLVHNPGTFLWNGPYLTILKPDPWKHRYGYACRDESILIRSAGPDGIEDTADDLLETGVSDATNTPAAAPPPN